MSDRQRPVPGSPATIADGSQGAPGPGGCLEPLAGAAHAINNSLACLSVSLAQIEGELRARALESPSLAAALAEARQAAARVAEVVRTLGPPSPTLTDGDMDNGDRRRGDAPPSPPGLAARGAAPGPASPPRRGRLLLVDDEPLVARAASRLLAREHEITVAHSAVEALERIQRGEAFDLVLCDLMMPGVSGIDFHERLSRLQPDLAAHVVFVSGGAYTESARRFLATSGHPCVEKPFDAGALRAAVNRALAARSG